MPGRVLPEGVARGACPPPPPHAAATLPLYRTRPRSPPPPPQIPRARPHDYKLMKKSQRTVSRAYGGVLCAACLRDRVMRAFIVEEQKTVKVYAKSA